MAYTGSFPEKNSTNIASFRAAEMKRQGIGFKKAKPADAHVQEQRLTDDTAIDPEYHPHAGKESR
jgi:hypothetical protein